MSTPKKTTALRQSLRARHLMMISIGGTIGVGLFLGIADPLTSAGPLGTILAYLSAGIVMIATMMCLGELSTSFPHAGSFQYYVLKFFKRPGLSFVIGWIYWLSWVFALTAALLAGGLVASELWPVLSVWGWMAVFLPTLVIINALSARSFGETEYWLAGIKVFAIVLFIASGSTLIGHQMLTTDWVPTLRTESGAFFPNGWGAVIASMAVVVYSFQGVELVGNVAGEAEHPEKVIPKVIQGLGIRLILFYVISVAILALLNPNGYVATDSGPFVEVFNRLGFNGADIFMRCVILSAALSAANSALYACSRMLWSMATARVAPKVFAYVHPTRQVPFYGVFFTALLAVVFLYAQDVSPQRLFLFFVNSTAQVGCVAWILIALCQLRYRWGVNRGEYPKLSHTYQSPWYPFNGLFVIVANLAIIVGSWFTQDGGISFVAQLVLVAVATVAYQLFFKEDARRQA